MDFDVRPRMPLSEEQTDTSSEATGSSSTMPTNALAAIAPSTNLGHVYDEPASLDPELAVARASSPPAPPLTFGQASMHVLRNIPGAGAMRELAGALLPGGETLQATQDLWEGNQTIGGVLKTAGSEAVDYAVDKSASRMASLYGTGKALYQYQSGEGSAEDIAFAAAGVIGGRKFSDLLRGWWPRRKDPKTEFEASLRKDPMAARNALDLLKTAEDGPTKKAALRVLADSVDMPACLDWRGNCGNAAKSLILAIKHDAPLTSIPYRKRPVGFNDPNRDYDPNDYLDPGTAWNFDRREQTRLDHHWIRSELGKDGETSWPVGGAELRKYLDHQHHGLEEGQLGILYQEGYAKGKLSAHDLVVTRIGGELVVVNNNGGNAPARDRMLRSLSEWQEHWSREATDARYHVVKTEVFLPGTASNEPPPLWELKGK